jgi:DNA repair ATPase RecN
VKELTKRESKVADKIDLVVDRLEDVKESCDKIREDVGAMKLNVARNTDSLDLHMKRTDFNEDRIKMIEERLTVTYLLKLAISASVGLGAIAGAMFSVIKVIGYL